MRTIGEAIPESAGLTLQALILGNYQFGACAREETEGSDVMQIEVGRATHTERLTLQDRNSNRLCFLEGRTVGY